VGILCLFTGTTDKVIIISALGAVVMYAISMISLLKLRRTHKDEGGFQTPFYPWFPITALVLSLVCLAAIAVYNPILTLIFFCGLLAVLIIFIASGKHRDDEGKEPGKPLKEELASH
jgi:ethanolamine permease